MLEDVETHLLMNLPDVSNVELKKEITKRQEII